MADYLVRSISDKLNVIGLACVTTHLVNEARELHGTSRTAAAALGRALTGGLLMAALLKRGQQLALRFEGNGPLKKIMIEADHEGLVRGFIGVPEAEVPIRDEKLNIAGALGSEGFLTVVKDLGLKEPYRGITKLQSGEIGEDIAYYYAESEQIPTAVGLGVFVEPDGIISASGGFLIQALPPAENRIIEQLIENIRKIPGVTDFLCQGKRPEDFLEMMFTGIPYHLLGKQDLFLRCTCSRERVEKVLIALGPDELRQLISEKGETDVTCEFCRSKFHFTGEELEALARESVSPDNH